ncbi:lipocalin-like domain-containing protein [Burkholderia multivorans]|uniref:lipocalin-like domain-containing protein n=1 Tax=Burkholderia multivorans TaxID=87883 RepID=UPI000B5A2904
MKIAHTYRSAALASLAAASFWISSVCLAGSVPTELAGTWELVAADVEHPDGTRGPDYGADPSGLLIIDKQGRYSLQIFKSERERFSSGDKASGTPTEYRDAVMGSSTHFGTISINSRERTIVFRIQHASFPNWEGTQQPRTYELKGTEFSYRVTPRPNGDIPISIWKRLD